MENIKVKVENNLDELVLLFGDLGCKYFNHTCSVKNYMIYQDGKCFFVKSRKEFNMYDCKELTIPQLRDLVVLKRNDVGDATHINFRTNTPFLVQGSKEYFYLNNKWILSDSVNDLKPIEEKEMKEYPRKNSDGKYILEVTDEREAKEPHAKHWIEVPKGCDYLISNVGVNSFIDSDMFAKVKPKNILWSRKEMKEFLVNHDDKWTLQLLDSDTEENSYRVAVPSGAEIYAVASDGIFTFWSDDYQWDDGDIVRYIKQEDPTYTFREWKADWKAKILWQRSETEYLMQCVNGDKLMESIAQLNNQDTVKVTIDELKHRVYKKDVSHLDSIDVYRVLELFNVHSHAVGHAIKKLLCSGGRGAKDEAQDIQEAIDSLVRYQEMKNEDE